MLNIVNKSPLERTSFATCLRLAAPGAILLIEDAVYGALAGTAFTPQLEVALARFPVYALKPDLDARAVTDRVAAGVKLVDYEGFVDLVAEHHACQSWL